MCMRCNKVANILLATLKKCLLYSVSIVLCCYLFVEIGSELITQYTLYTNEFSQDEKHLLADDLGFGILLFMGLVPELVFGGFVGVILANKISSKLSARHQ